MRLFFSFIATIIVFTSVCSAAEPSIDSFRVENELAVQQTGVKVKTTTLFRQGIVYDMIGDNGETTIFDTQNDTFTLLEPTFRFQTQIRASELKETVLKHREKMRSEKNPFFAFAAFPKFEETYEEESGLARFQSPWIDYQIETLPLDDDSLRQRYYDFCDWYCFLNLRVNPDSTTLFARMEVNRFLNAQKRFPKKIQVSVFRKGNSGIAGIVTQPDVYVSTHKLGTRFVPEDEQRLIRVEEQRKTFRTVSFAEYQKEMKN